LIIILLHEIYKNLERPTNSRKIKIISMCYTRKVTPEQHTSDNHKKSWLLCRVPGVGHNPILCQSHASLRSVFLSIIRLMQFGTGRLLSLIPIQITLLVVIIWMIFAFFTFVSSHSQVLDLTGRKILLFFHSRPISKVVASHPDLDLFLVCHGHYVFFDHIHLYVEYDME
jgi:hypothetical protein